MTDPHGAEAPIHAAMKVDAMLEKGDMGGATTWQRVIKAVEEMLATKRRGGDALH